MFEKKNGFLKPGKIFLTHPCFQAEEAFLLENETGSNEDAAADCETEADHKVPLRMQRHEIGVRHIAI
jgi:hypothetical protein